MKSPIVSFLLTHCSCAALVFGTQIRCKAPCEIRVESVQRRDKCRMTETAPFPGGSVWFNIGLGGAKYLIKS